MFQGPVVGKMVASVQNSDGDACLFFGARGVNQNGCVVFINGGGHEERTQEPHTVESSAGSTTSSQFGGSGEPHVSLGGLSRTISRGPHAGLRVCREPCS